jgi:hypothetical protein
MHLAIQRIRADRRSTRLSFFLADITEVSTGDIATASLEDASFDSQNLDDPVAAIARRRRIAIGTMAAYCIPVNVSESPRMDRDNCDRLSVSRVMAFFVTIPPHMAGKAVAAVALSRGHKKRSRTRTQILDAARRMYSRRDSNGVSLAGLAEEAELANGTVYNYFRSREEVMEATGVDLADQFSERIAATYAKLGNGAQRVAIGMRRFVRHGQEDQVRGRAVARISDTAKAMN